MFEFFILSEAIVLCLLQSTQDSTLPDSHHEPNWFISRNPNDIHFQLFYNQENPDVFNDIQVLNITSLYASDLKFGLPVVFLFHGLIPNIKSSHDISEIKNAYLSAKFPANIIMVKYGELYRQTSATSEPLLNLPISGFVKFDAPVIGKTVAKFVQFLIQNKALTGPDIIHLIGFSLGCQVVGEAANQIKKLLNVPVGRISGLDCPGQKFLIDKTDSKFVDVTNTHLGRQRRQSTAIGHVDFYVNGGGPVQPNCNRNIPFTEPYCSHASSIYYFAKSIREKIVGCKCEICADYFPKCPKGNDVTYGQHVSKRVRGKAYIKIEDVN